LREVREGLSYVVTSHGKPVARIAPVNDVRSESAKQALLRRLSLTARSEHRSLGPRKIVRVTLETST
jgi:prevent-host-death family protein